MCSSCFLHFVSHLQSHSSGTFPTHCSCLETAPRVLLCFCAEESGPERVCPRVSRNSVSTDDGRREADSSRHCSVDDEYADVLTSPKACSHIIMPQHRKSASEMALTLLTQCRLHAALALQRCNGAIPSVDFGPRRTHVN